MTMEDLYLEMKDSLKFFGLRFGDMQSVQVKVKDDSIVFSCGGRTISIDMKDE